MLINEGSTTFDVIDFVLFEKSLNTFCQWSNDSLFGLLDFTPVQISVSDLNTHFIEIMGEFVILVWNIK